MSSRAKRGIGSVIALLLLCVSIASAQSSLTGVIRDSATGRPLAGALIELRRDNVRRTAQSDDAGEFRLSPIPADAYRLTVRRLGFAERSREFQMGARDTSVMVTLIPIARDLDTMYIRAGVTGIYGVVGTSEGLRPLAGAKVQVMGANRSKVTDSAGTFFVALEQSGMYMVRITRAGYEHRIFPIAVTAGGAVDASRLLDSSGVNTKGLEMLWKDLDQRLGWRTMNSALVPGGEIRKAGSQLLAALEGSPSFVSRGLFIGDVICVFVNGAPRPGLPLDAIPVETIEVVELYGAKDEAVKTLMFKWPGSAPCGAANRIAGRRYEAPNGPRANAVARWAVVWLKR